MIPYSLSKRGSDDVFQTKNVACSDSIIVVLSDSQQEDGIVGLWMRFERPSKAIELLDNLVY